MKKVILTTACILFFAGCKTTITDHSKKVHTPADVIKYLEGEWLIWHNSTDRKPKIAYRIKFISTENGLGVWGQFVPQPSYKERDETRSNTRTLLIFDVDTNRKRLIRHDITYWNQANRKPHSSTISGKIINQTIEWNGDFPDFFDDISCIEKGIIKHTVLYKNNDELEVVWKREK